MKKLITLALLVFISCAQASTSSSTATAPTVPDTNLCGAADANLQKLACIPVGKPYTDKGKTFTEFCQETQTNGIAINPKCLSTITSCSQMAACNP